MKIRKLHIYKMPGFPRGLKEFARMANNVNVIAGPNGSGKSSTARVIQKLIWWKGKTTGYQVEAEIDVQEEQNKIEIESQSYTRTNRQKKTHDDFSHISPAEFSNQYMLALHDLVKDNDDNLANIIAREVNGGVDLRLASDKLGYKSNQPNAGHTHYKEYDNANNLFHELEKEQAGIIKEEENISELEEEKKQSEKASKLKDLFEKALRHLQSKEYFDSINIRMKQFPLSLSKMKEGDLKSLDNQERQIREIDMSLMESANIVEANREKISKLRIPHDEEMPEEHFYELEERIDNLKDLNQRIIACEKEIRQQQLIKDNAGKCFNADDTEKEFSCLRNLKLEQIRNLDEFVRIANDAAGSHRNLLGIKEQLEKERAGIESKITGNFPTDDLIKGIDILSDWLKGKQPTSDNSRFLWLLPLWGIISVLSGFYGGLTGIVIVVVLSLCAIPVLSISQKRMNHIRNIELDIRVADYQKLNLPLPQTWESEAIATKIQELLEETRLLIYKTHLENKIDLVSSDIEKSQIKCDEINSKYREYKHSIGSLPESLDRLTDNYNSFYVFLVNALKWQEAVDGLEKTEMEKQTLTDHFHQQLGEINRLLLSMNYPPMDTPEQVSSGLQKILKEKEIRKDALNEIAAQNTNNILREKEKVNCKEVLREIYDRLEIKDEQKNEVIRLNDQFADYREVCEQLNQEQGNLNANLKLLQEHSLFEEYKDAFSTMSLDELQTKIKEYTIQAEKQKELFQALADIRAKVKEKKNRYDIEVALGKKEEALSRLDNLLKVTVKSATGGMIISNLHDEISLNNENVIFKQANKILGAITKGRYSLTLREGIQPEFMARDNVLNQVQPLTEISTGTRVQLLLAIRLAYIESQENAVKLPLLADELLANSDDERSEAIIKSLIEISRNRQLFYFTAQADEVEKWKYYMRDYPGLDLEIIPLGNKFVEYDKNAPAIQPVTLLQEICPPEGFNHQNYKGQIGVAPFDLLEQSTPEIHLWYLIEDIDLLYTCLRHGFYQWGQLTSFLENTGKMPGLDEDALRNLKHKILIFERLKELCSYGHSRKINRDILVESGAVSDLFLDKMSELLMSNNYNPADFLESLDAGVIKGFRMNKKEELRQYLLDNKYISAASPYHEDDIYIKISALISNINIDKSEAERFLNYFIEQDTK